MSNGRAIQLPIIAEILVLSEDIRVPKRVALSGN